MPFDIYTTQSSCGPDSKTCALFNFRHIPGDYNKNRNEISENNVQFYSNLLINLYRKTASLFPHNVALVLLGGDFAYANEHEFDQQYSNYVKLFNYINSHSNEEFNGATVQFGTASDYFNEIKKRQGDNFPTFIGDFFPYADIYNTGEPNYWTGFYTTRPFYKLLSRELEHNLRNSEILFTICFNKMRQLKENSIELKILQRNYGKIVKARKNLGLFQHHDAITGTSKQYVMKDYQKMLENSIKETINVQRNFIEILSTENLRNFLELESERSPKSSLKMKKVIEIKKEESKKILLFNSLSHDRYEVISVHVSSSYVSAFDSKEKLLNSQINPIFINGKISSNIMELLILIFIPALSIKIIELREELNQTLADERTSKILTGDLEEVFIENSQMKLIFDSDSGFLNSMIQKQLNEELKLQISFDAYQSVPKKSGAYLFRAFRVYEEFFESYIKKTIYIVNGPIASEVTVIYGNLLKHTLKIFNTQTYLDDVISINNVIDFEDFQMGNMKDKEMIMRIKSSTANIDVEEEREFFTDLNGFQFQPRKTTRKLEIEGNYYPITSLIFIQDEIQRLSLLTTHAQGATSSDHGVIEVMLDRKIMMDDGYGMGEGIFVNPKTEQNFLLTLENFKKLDEDRPEKQYHVPSLLVHHLTNSLNYPVTYFIVGHKNKNIKLNEMKLFNFNLPCDVNLINFRTMSDIELDWLPTENSLLILHRVGFDYYLNNENFSEQICKNYENDFQSLQFVNKVRTKKIQMTSLTGTENGKFITTFTNDMLEPMEIKTFKITFH
ncbi:hypothetical protein PVAND_012028 [Polypedilum vanderplanki]|uniref:Alpha-mannosidase n=1 Tax=Polypedilum vanderplanki TaxID=319348 RepID=A0A9J6CL68_POLVA|nr:hypothetical protein PVAND_012028 [Polypedilum vanderplanki]